MELEPNRSKTSNTKVNYRLCILKPKSKSYIGHIDVAQIITSETNYVATLSGWICNPFNDIKNLFIGFGDKWYKASHGHLRQDVSNAFSRIKNTANSGFNATWSGPLIDLEYINWQKPLKFRAVSSAHKSEYGSFRKGFTYSQLGHKEILGQKQNIQENAKNNFDSFMSAGLNLVFPKVENPKVSVIIPVFNKAELTYNCLRTLVSSQGVSFEVIIINNASTDRTNEFLERVKNIRYFNQTENLHFIRGSNLGAKNARGQYLLFLNNDTELLPDSIYQAYKTISEDEKIGAVGAKTLYPDLTLAEAGSIIWRNGNTMGYGRGYKSHDPAIQFRRNVQYCSGSFLMTSKKLFYAMGMFSQDYLPAYYEDADYCLQLHKKNYEVIYEPRCTIIHHQGASSTNSKEIYKHYTTNRRIFLKNHRDLIDKLLPQSPRAVIESRKFETKKRILFIEDKIPHILDGCGYPRSNHILAMLEDLGFDVTIYSMQKNLESWSQIYKDISQNQEVVTASGNEGLPIFLLDRAKYYDIIWVARPHNIKSLLPIIQPAKKINKKLKFIFDSEALFSKRDIVKAAVLGKALPKNISDSLLKEELNLYSSADHIVAVTESEASVFKEFTKKPVTILSHIHQIHENKNRFSDRKNFLFVGPLYDDTTPNTDSMAWFIHKVWPLIKNKLPAAEFHLYGHDQSILTKNIKDPRIIKHGPVENIAAVFDQYRVVVAPTRFAAGLPHKVTEAAAHGVPQVVTSLLASQLGWTNGKEALVADVAKEFARCCIDLYKKPKLWEKIRENSLLCVDEKFSKKEFVKSAKNILDYKENPITPIDVSKIKIPPPSLKESEEVGQGDFEQTSLEFLNYFVNLAQLHPHHDIIDIGCGIGRMAYGLTSYVLPNIRYEGFDVSEVLTHWPRKNISSSFPSFRFQHVDIYNGRYNPQGTQKDFNFKFPYENESFDRALLVSVFTHMHPAGVKNYLKETYRVLRPGGKAFISCFLSNDEVETLKQKGLSKENFAFEKKSYYFNDQTVTDSLVCFKEEHLKNWLTGTGFKKIDTYFGVWSGRDEGFTYQDILVIEK